MISPFNPQNLQVGVIPCLPGENEAPGTGGIRARPRTGWALPTVSGSCLDSSQPTADPQAAGPPQGSTSLSPQVGRAHLGTCRAHPDACARPAEKAPGPWPGSASSSLRQGRAPKAGGGTPSLTTASTALGGLPQLPSGSHQLCPRPRACGVRGSMKNSRRGPACCRQAWLCPSGEGAFLMRKQLGGSIPHQVVPGEAAQAPTQPWPPGSGHELPPGCD